MGVIKFIGFVCIPAFIYAAIMISVPWADISVSGFPDHEVYVDYLNQSMESKREIYGWSSWTEYLTGEVLWDEMVLGLMSIYGNAAQVLLFVSFLTCFFWAVLAFSLMPVWWSVLFLTNPITVDVMMSVQRNGFAWSLVLLGLCTKSKPVRYGLFAVAPFIHTSALGLIGLYLLSELLKSRTRFVQVLGMVGAGVFLGLVLTVGNQILFNLLGDRRLSVDYFSGGASYLQMLFFFLLFLMAIFQNKRFTERNLLVIGLIAWYLVMNPMIPWSYRLWACAMPIIAFAVWDLARGKREIFLMLWLGYSFIQFFYWSKLNSFVSPLSV